MENIFYEKNVFDISGGYKALKKTLVTNKQVSISVTAHLYECNEMLSFWHEVNGLLEADN